MAVTEIGVSGGRGRPNISSTSMTSVVSEARVLEAYSAHPSHVSIVKGNMLPIINDIMTVDSIADDLSTDNLVPLLGSAIRISFLKLKEDANKDEVLSAVKGILENFKQISEGRK